MHYSRWPGRPNTTAPDSLTCFVAIVVLVRAARCGTIWRARCGFGDAETSGGFLFRPSVEDRAGVGARCEPPASSVAGAFFSQPVFLKGQEPERHRRESGMVMPTDPAAGFVLVQPTLPFAALKVHLHTPATAGDFRQLVSNNLPRYHFRRATSAILRSVDRRI